MKDREAGRKKSKIIYNRLRFREGDRDEGKYYERKGGRKGCEAGRVGVV